MDSKIDKLKSEAYDIIRTMDALRIRLGQVNSEISVLEQEKRNEKEMPKGSELPKRDKQRQETA